MSYKYPRMYVQHVIICRINFLVFSFGPSSNSYILHANLMEAKSETNINNQTFEDNDLIFRNPFIFLRNR